MSLRKKQGNLKFYLAELLILVLGITLSFWLNDWRQGKAELIQLIDEELMED